MRDLSTYISEACSISEARRLSDLKGKLVGKIEVGDDNLYWSKSENDCVSINDIGGLKEKDMDEMYNVYEKKGRLYVGFAYEKSMWNMEFYNAPGNRISVNIYKDFVWIDKAVLLDKLQNFRVLWYHTLPKILKAF